MVSFLLARVCFFTTIVFNCEFVCIVIHVRKCLKRSVDSTVESADLLGTLGGRGI